ncbi:CASTOR/POLLUX-related putative ion channel [Salinisphaera aquimarina]|uniref:CASTOR/POLLUX/SYM8 ion channel conserved domain-containing protein n=1 Tax=Salinisphaera aquimarina TaxID=2094031 RepID=A0ABV7EL93_9GAMM
MNLVTRIRNLGQFQLEQFILRGALSRLMVIALAMVLIAGGAGLLVYTATPTPSEAYPDAGSAVWWAFLRLTDSGYLGDDEGALLRTVSTILTVLGVVLFVGALIATMTQWLNDTIETLEAGYTPIAQNNHVLILGWNNRTASMVEDLVESEGRVARFLSRHGGRRLRIVILAERVSPALMQEIKDKLGRRFDSRRITLRSGTPLRVEHLRRVDYLHAAVILLPTREFDADGSPDELTIKALMSAAHSDDEVEPQDLPLVVAEIFDADRLETARRAYPGPAEFIGTPLIISRLLVQNARHPGLSWIYNELLGGHGNQIFVRKCPELAGQRMIDVAACFEDAILLGIARNGELQPLYADNADTVTENDPLAFIAADFDDCKPTRDAQADEQGRARPPFHSDSPLRNRRVLVLGWNQKLPSLLAEFDAYERESVEVDVFSLLSIGERETTLLRKGVQLDHARVNQLEGDLTSHYEVGLLDVASYDSIILVASDWLGSADAADARMLLGYLVLSRLLEDVANPPRLVVETMSTDNAKLFDVANVERLVSPDLQASMLTQVALRRELHWVMEELFGAGGAEVEFRDVTALGLAGASRSFEAMRLERAAYGEVLLGTLADATGAAPRLRLNPHDKQALLELADGDELVVLAVA